MKRKVLIISLVVIVIFSLILFGKKVESKNENNVAIFTYHLIVEDEDFHEEGLSKSLPITKLSDFENEMKFLKDNNYKVIPMEEFQHHIYNKKDFAPKTVLITFDDGYYSNIQYAYPILKEYNFPATTFIIGKMTEHAKPDAKLRYISIEEMNDTKDIFTYGGHTYDLHYFDDGKSRLVSSSEEVVKDDLKKLSNIGEFKYFAYPYGMYSAKNEKILEDFGYKLGFLNNNELANLNSRPFEIPRISINSMITFEDFVKFLILLEKDK